MQRNHRALVLSLLLLLLAFAGGQAVADARSCTDTSWGAVSVCAPNGGDREQSATAVWEHSEAALHQAGHRPSTAARSAGDGGDAPHGGARKAAALSPALFSPNIIHSMAALKQRRYALLSRTEWEQRLALFPKHGFW